MYFATFAILYSFLIRLFQNVSIASYFKHLSQQLLMHVSLINLPDDNDRFFPLFGQRFILVQQIRQFRFMFITFSTIHQPLCSSYMRPTKAHKCLVKLNKIFIKRIGKHRISSVFKSNIAY